MKGLDISSMRRRKEKSPKISEVQMTLEIVEIPTYPDKMDRESITPVIIIITSVGTPQLDQAILIEPVCKSEVFDLRIKRKILTKVRRNCRNFGLQINASYVKRKGIC